MVDGISQDFSKHDPVVLRVYVHNGTNKNIEYYTTNIVHLLHTLSDVNDVKIVLHLSYLVGTHIDTREKTFILYKLISHFYFTYCLGEARVIPYKTFMSKLREYNDKKDCDVEFRIDHNQMVNTFKILTRGKYYYYDKITSDDKIGMNYEVNTELMKVIFPD